MANLHRYRHLALAIALGGALCACQGAVDRRGDNSIHSAPDSTVEANRPAVAPTPEPPPGAPSHP